MDQQGPRPAGVWGRQNRDSAWESRGLMSAGNRVVEVVASGRTQLSWTLKVTEVTRVRGDSPGGGSSMCKGTEAQDTGRPLVTVGTLDVTSNQESPGPDSHAHDAHLSLAQHIALMPALPTPAPADITSRLCSSLHRPHTSLRFLSV